VNKFSHVQKTLHLMGVTVNAAAVLVTDSNLHILAFHVYVAGFLLRIIQNLNNLVVLPHFETFLLKSVFCFVLQSCFSLYFLWKSLACEKGIKPEVHFDRSRKTKMRH